jgi:hypothetical protein
VTEIRPLFAFIPRQRLWVGIAAAPLAWVAAELVGYGFVGWYCDRHASGLPASYLITLAITLLVAATGLTVGIGNWRVAIQETGAVGLPRFLAKASVFVSMLFLFGILLMAAGGGLIGGCRGVTP